MRLNVFSWIRERVRKAALAGVADALADLCGGEPDDEAQRAIAIVRDGTDHEPTPTPNGHRLPAGGNGAARKVAAK